MNGLMTGRPFTYHVVHRYYGRYLAHLGPSTAPTRSRFPRPPYARGPIGNPRTQSLALPTCAPPPSDATALTDRGPRAPIRPRLTLPACLLSLHRFPPLALQASNGREGDQEDGLGSPPVAGYL
jgi:hypothetical protein